MVICTGLIYFAENYGIFWIGMLVGDGFHSKKNKKVQLII